MKKAPLFFLFILAGTTALSAVDGLWEKALVYGQAMEEWAPGRQTIEAHEFNRQGEITSTTFTQYTNSLSPAGELVSEVIRSEKDGKDNTEKARKELRKQQEEGRQMEEINPFLPRFQEKLTLQALPGRERINGIPCRAYRFVYTTEDDKGKTVTFPGKAWITEEEGRPVRAQHDMDPLPGPVKTLRADYFFEKADNGEVMLTRTDFEIKVQVLFVVKHFTTTTLYTAFTRRTP